MWMPHLTVYELLALRDAEVICEQNFLNFAKDMIIACGSMCDPYEFVLELIKSIKSPSTTGFRFNLNVSQLGNYKIQGFYDSDLLGGIVVSVSFDFNREKLILIEKKGI